MTTPRAARHARLAALESGGAAGPPTPKTVPLDSQAVGCLSRRQAMQHHAIAQAQARPGQA